MKRLYLACPYSHWNPVIQLLRWLWVSWAAYRLMLRGYAVFSPISHSVPISWFQSKKDNCHNFWIQQDFEYLDAYHIVMVLALPGWDKSTGVDYEITRAKAIGLPIELIHYRTLKKIKVLNG